MKTVLVCAMLAGLSAAVLLGLTREASVSAAKKLERIEAEALRPGEVLSLTEDELNSYFKYDYAAELPSGVRNLRITLFQDASIVQASVDVSKIENQSGALSMIGRALFEGEQQIRSRCHYVSAGGEATVDVEWVEVDGRQLPRFVLEWLISSLVQPRLPEFQLGKPSPLPANLNQIRLEPGRAVIIAN